MTKTTRSVLDVAVLTRVESNLRAFGRTMSAVPDPSHGPSGNTWLAITETEPPIAAAYQWAVQPDCGAVVLFSGTARDHSKNRPDVSQLAYEAYEEHLLERFERLVDEIRNQWPDVRRVVIMHRVGEVPIGESTVIVVAASPHRDAAFEAARYGIDRLKATAPVWKREVWAEGESWGLDAREIDEVGIGSPAPEPRGSAAK